MCESGGALPLRLELEVIPDHLLLLIGHTNTFIS